MILHECSDRLTDSGQGQMSFGATQASFPGESFRSEILDSQHVFVKSSSFCSKKFQIFVEMERVENGDRLGLFDLPVLPQLVNLVDTDSDEEIDVCGTKKMGEICGRLAICFDMFLMHCFGSAFSAVHLC